MDVYEWCNILSGYYVETFDDFETFETLDYLCEINYNKYLLNNLTDKIIKNYERT